MIPEVYRSDVSRAVCSFLLAADQAERQRVIDTSGPLLLTPQADGLLAVLTAMHRDDLPFRDRIEVLRLSMDEARHDGYDGQPRELASYFASFEDGQPGYQIEPSLTDPAAELISGAQAGAVSAFALSRSWAERHRIVTAFPSLFATGLPAQLCGQVSPLASRGTIIADPAFWTSVGGILQRVRSLGARVLLDPGLPAVFAPAHPSPPQPVLFEGTEYLQLLVLAFAEAPTWELRGRLAGAHPQLLTPEAADLLRLAQGTTDDRDRLELCAVMLGKARTEGPQALAGDLPPTGARLDPALPGRLAAAIEAGQHDTAAILVRRCLHMVDEVLAPRRWALLNRQLAGLLAETADPAMRAMHGEEAILRITRALGVFGRHEDPDGHLAALVTCGTVLAGRSRGDRVSSLATGRACLEAARQGYSDRGHDLRAADTSLLLAGLLALTPRPSPDEPASAVDADLRAAQRHASAAAEAFAGAGDKAGASRAAVTLAGALLRRGQYVHRGDPTPAGLAIGTLEQVLRTPETTDVACASMLLAQALVDRGDLTKDPACYARAVACLRQCLDQASPADPWLRARIHDLLGTAYYRSAPDDDRRLSSAVRHHRAALGLLGPALAAERRAVLVALGASYFRLGRWQECREALAEADGLADARPWLTLSRSGQFGEIADRQDTRERHAYALLRCGEPGQALAHLHPVDAGPLCLPTPPVRSADLGPLTALAPAGGALVLPLVTPSGAAVWILTGDPQDPPHGEVLDLPDLTESDLRRLLTGDEEEAGWFGAYADFGAALGDERGVRGPVARGRFDLDDAAELALRAWDAAIDQAAAELSDLLTEPIAAVLRRKGLRHGAEVVIVPSRWLSILPLHAAWRRTAQGRRHCFGIEFVVSYAPSLHALRQAGQRAAGRTGRPRSLLAVWDADLDAAQAEITEVAQYFEADRTLVLTGDGATAGAVLSKAPEYSHIHYACHGAFSPADPRASAVYLGAGEPLSVEALGAGEVFASARLVTLSSCESGVTAAECLPREYLGLAGAFLRAGAPCVLTCLWSVDDRATRLLMRTFYDEHLVRGVPPARALQAAQRTLRGHPLFAHPYFWAAFIVVGAAGG